MSYFKKLKKPTGRTRFLLALLTLLFGFSANAATYKVSDTPADLANLANGAKVVMYNIGASKLVGYNNGAVSKTEKAVTDADYAAYVKGVEEWFYRCSRQQHFLWPTGHLQFWLLI